MSFFIDSELFLVVGRNFRSECSIKDYGTLVFQLMNGKRFHLVQRLDVNDANHVMHYEMKRQHYLVIDDQNMISPSVRVFRRKTGTDCVFESFQTIPTRHLSDMIILNFGTSEQLDKLLVTVNDSTLEVRRQSGLSGFTQSWSVPVDGGSSVQPWSTNDHRLFFIVGQSRKCSGSLVFELLTTGSPLLPVIFNTNQSSSVVK